MTIKEAIAWSERSLQNISDAPHLDAERLLLHAVTQSESSWLYSHQEELLSEQQLACFEENVKNRTTGKPLAYILGYQEFYGRRFFVDNNVLVPRPATEELINQALKAIKEISSRLNRALVLADIGTGSGCIAITLALELPELITKFYATDISQEALAVAQKNIESFKLSNVITTLRGNMLEPLKEKTIDLIVSNPPYVPSAEVNNINVTDPQTAGLKFEPSKALNGGPNGLKYINLIKTSNIPAVLESINGEILIVNLDR